MRILLHICCANCATYPYQELKQKGFRVVGFWYNPNIHPFLEYQRRLETLRQFAEQSGLEVIYKDEYNLVEFLRAVVFREKARCPICYQLRLEETAKAASENQFDIFTTSLLISPYQDHERIKRIGEALAKEFGISFYYEDFREGYRESVRISKELNLYRQKYCGCIYSEAERFGKISLKPQIDTD